MLTENEIAEAVLAQREDIKKPIALDPFEKFNRAAADWVFAEKVAGEVAARFGVTVHARTPHGQTRCGALSAVSTWWRCETTCDECREIWEKNAAVYTRGKL